MSDTQVRFKDFSRKRSPVFFTIGEERFDCIVAMPVETLQEFTRQAANVTNENAFTSMTEFFDTVLQPAAATRIKAMMSDKNNPLELGQASEIFNWLLEVYGLRPTTSSSDSSDGSPTDGDGTTSTAGA